MRKEELSEKARRGDAVRGRAGSLERHKSFFDFLCSELSGPQITVIGRRLRLAQIMITNTLSGCLLSVLAQRAVDWTQQQRWDPKEVTEAGSGKTLEE